VFFGASAKLNSGDSFKERSDKEIFFGGELVPLFWRKWG